MSCFSRTGYFCAALWRNKHRRPRLHAGADCMGPLAAWHSPGGPVGPPATWAASSNVE